MRRVSYQHKTSRLFANKDCDDNCKSDDCYEKYYDNETKCTKKCDWYVNVNVNGNGHNSYCSCRTKGKVLITVALKKQISLGSKSSDVSSPPPSLFKGERTSSQWLKSSCVHFK
jgi:hypothetical protein